jgi:hypothetical protein
MKTVEKEVLSLGFELVKSLEAEGFDEEAKHIEDLLEDRYIWDRMAILLYKQADFLLTSKKLKKQTRKIAFELKQILSPYVVSIDKYPLYKSVVKLISKLREVGLSEWAKRLDDSMKSGSTGSEIYAEIRWNLLQIESASLPITPEIAKMIKEVCNEINKEIGVSP